MALLLLALALLWAFLVLAPPFLAGKVGASLLNLGDWVDMLFTSLAIIGVMYLIMRRLSQAKGEDSWSGWLVGLFVLSAIAFANGQGAHLAANAASHYLESTGDAYAVTYFFDEHYGHVVWHIGLMGMSSSLILWELNLAETVGLGTGGSLLLTLGALLFALGTAPAAIEGQTVALVLPLAVALSAGSSWKLRRKGLRLYSRPVTAFFVV